MSMCCCLTAKDKGEKKLFGYSFVPLMQEDGRTLPDGIHELIIHKVLIACTQDFDWTTRSELTRRLAGYFLAHLACLAFISGHNPIQDGLLFWIDKMRSFHCFQASSLFNKEGGSHACQKIQAASLWLPTTTLFIVKFHLEKPLSEATYCHAWNASLCESFAPNSKMQSPFYHTGATGLTNSTHHDRPMSNVCLRNVVKLWGWIWLRMSANACKR